MRRAERELAAKGRYSWVADIRARPELASDEERICPLFGFTPEAYREAEREELAQADGGL